MPWDLDDLEEDEEFAGDDVVAPVQPRESMQADDDDDKGNQSHVFPPIPPGQTPIIFLEVEGVLHPQGSDNWFGEEQMLQLKRVVDATQARIVLSSDWRLDAFQLKKVVAVMEEYGIHNLIGSTLDMSSANPDADPLELKTGEIQTWLEDNEDFVDEDHWVALDPQMLDTETEDGTNHTVQTDGSFGLSPDKADMAITILTASA